MPAAPPDEHRRNGFFSLSAQARQDANGKEVKRGAENRSARRQERKGAAETRWFALSRNFVPGSPAPDDPENGEPATAMPTADARATQGRDGSPRGAVPLRPETPRQKANAKSRGDAETSPSSTMADVGVGGVRAARRAGRARVPGRGGEVGGDGEDEIDELRAMDRGTAARDEADAAMVAPSPPRPTSASTGGAQRDEPTAPASTDARRRGRRGRRGRGRRAARRRWSHGGAGQGRRRRGHVVQRHGKRHVALFCTVKHTKPKNWRSKRKRTAPLA